MYYRFYNGFNDDFYGGLETFFMEKFSYEWLDIGTIFGEMLMENMINDGMLELGHSREEDEKIFDQVLAEYMECLSINFASLTKEEVELIKSIESILEGLEGWYWWASLPGCLPDSEPIGPFGTEKEALADAWQVPLDQTDELLERH